MRLARLWRPSAFKLSLLVALGFALVRWQDRHSAAGETPVLRTLEHALGDLHFRERLWISAPQPPKGVVLIAADEKSISAAGLWPWPRERYAQLIEQLTRAGATAIAFDVAFIDSYDSNAAAGTDALAQAIHHSGRTIQAFILLNADEAQHLDAAAQAERLARLAQGRIGEPATALPSAGGGTELRPLRVRADIETYDAVQAPLREIAGAGSWFGYFNAIPDDDGVVRRWPLVARVGDKTFFPAIDLSTVALVCGAASLHFVTPLTDGEQDGRLSGVAIDCADRTLTIPLTGRGELTVDFPVRWLDYPKLSAIDVATGQFPAEAVRGKVALVAATAEGTHDIRSTPLDRSVPGGVVHVAAIDQMLRGRHLSRPYWAIVLELALILTLGSAFGWLFSSLALPWALASLIGGLALTQLLSFGFFLEGLDLCSALPPVELLFLFPTVIGYRYLTVDKEKRFIREAFRFYLTPSVMDAVLADPSKLKLGGDKRELTVLFSDIRGFTGLSERLPPERLVHLLNEYLTPMTDLVFENGGTLDKYMGDAIMAFFGAPVEQPDHALRACRTACQMLERLGQLRERWATEGLPPIEIGIGINTGPMVVGNMGSQSRFDYTVMGDAVNLGSRLEGTNKIYQTRAIISEFSYQQVKDQVVVRELDAVIVKGRVEPVRIFELVAVGEPPADWIARGGPEITASYERALRLFRERHFEEASAILRESMTQWLDIPTLQLLERCESLKIDPPPPDWKGVSELHTK